MKRLYTTEEIAARLKVKATTVTKWIRTGKMPGTKVGRSYLVSENGVNAFLGDIDAYFQTLVEAVPAE